MTDVEQNKRTARRVYEEGLNQGRLEVLDELLDPEAVNHAAPPDHPGGPEGAKAIFRMIRDNAPEYQLTVHHVIGEDDLVAVHGTGATGPMRGEFFGVDVTGRSTEVPQVHIFRFRDGRIVEHWGIRSDLTAMRELGVVEPVASG